MMLRGCPADGLAPSPAGMQQRSWLRAPAVPRRVGGDGLGTGDLSSPAAAKPRRAGCGVSLPLRLSGPAGRAERPRTPGNGAWGHQARTSFCEKPELAPVPLRIRPPAWEQRCSKISKPFVWKRNFLSDLNRNQPSQCSCSLHCSPCPCPALPGTRYPPAPALRNTWVALGTPHTSTYTRKTPWDCSSLCATK